MFAATVEPHEVAFGGGAVVNPEHAVLMTQRAN
jgi:hypothetical protein